MTLEDLIAVTYGADDSMSLTAQIHGLFRNDGVHERLEETSSRDSSDSDFTNTREQLIETQQADYNYSSRQTLQSVN